jgi:hypothetical protein
VVGVDELDRCLAGHGSRNAHCGMTNVVASISPIVRDGAVRVTMFWMMSLA